MSLACAAGLSLAVAGCQSDAEDDTPAQTAAATEEALRANELSVLPPDIRPRVMDELGDVQITNAELVPTEGGNLYRVTYIENGDTKRAVYDRAGRRQEVAGDVPSGAPVRSPADAEAGPGLDLRDAAPPSTRPAGGGAPPSTRPAGGGPQ